MSELAPFYAAIKANVHDDAPRLIFADFLEEQGKKLRAEFIRMQIAFDKNDASALQTPPDVPIRVKRQWMDQDIQHFGLLPQNALMSCQMYDRLLLKLQQFRRGFLTTLSLSIRDVRSLLRKGPVDMPALRIIANAVGERERLLNFMSRPSDLRVRHLDLSNALPHGYAQNVLQNLPIDMGVTSLDLSHNNFHFQDASEANQDVQNTAMESLREIRLVGCEIEKPDQLPLQNCRALAYLDIRSQWTFGQLEFIPPDFNFRIYSLLVDTVSIHTTVAAYQGKGLLSSVPCQEPQFLDTCKESIDGLPVYDLDSFGKSIAHSPYVDRPFILKNFCEGLRYILGGENNKYVAGFQNFPVSRLSSEFTNVKGSSKEYSHLILQNESHCNQDNFPKLLSLPAFAKLQYLVLNPPQPEAMPPNALKNIRAQRALRHLDMLGYAIPFAELRKLFLLPLLERCEATIDCNEPHGPIRQSKSEKQSVLQHLGITCTTTSSNQDIPKDLHLKLLPLLPSSLTSLRLDVGKHVDPNAFLPKFFSLLSLYLSQLRILDIEAITNYCPSLLFELPEKIQLLRIHSSILRENSFSAALNSLRLKRGTAKLELRFSYQEPCVDLQSLKRSAGKFITLHFE